MEGIALGQVVHSRAGRDKDKYFIVVGIKDNDYVLISDGNLHKIDSPKKKKIKHLVIHDKFLDDIRKCFLENIRVTDADINKSLKLLGL